MIKHRTLLLFVAVTFATAATLDYTHPDPPTWLGSAGNGFYQPTGIWVYGTDGSVAWQYKSPYDTEGVWDIMLTSYATVATNPPVLREPLNKPFTWPPYEPPTYTNPVITPGPAAQVPEPSVSWLVGIALIAVSIYFVRRSDRRRWGG